MNTFLKYIFLWTLLLGSASLFAQDEIIIVGQIVDKIDQQPIANAIVFLDNCRENTVFSDKNGYFAIRTATPKKKLFVTMLGYKKKEVKLKGFSQGLQIELTEDTKLLDEFMFVCDGKSAIKWIKQAQKKKTENNIRYINSNSVLSQQTQASISQISRKTLNSRLFIKLHKGIIAKEDSNLLLPVYSSTEKFHPLKDNQREILGINEKSIIPDQSGIVKELKAKMPNLVNFYNNYLTVFDKNLLSPLADSGEKWYNYYMKDSVITQQGKQYIISFSPVNKKDLAFAGIMQIDSATAALTKIDADLLPTANINFIEQLAFSQSFEKDKDEKWKLKQQTASFGFSLKNTRNKDLTNTFFVSQETFIQSTDSNGVILSAKDSLFNQSFSSAIDTLSKEPIVKKAGVLADILLNDYIHVGKFDFGPLNILGGYNQVEGNRIRLGGRTGKALFPNFTVGGYGAYGFRDKKWKYGGEMQYRFKSNKYTLAGVKYNNDVFRLEYDYHDDIYDEDAIGLGLADLPTLLRIYFPKNYCQREMIDFFIDKQLRKGLSSHFSLKSTNYTPNSYIPFSENGTDFNYLRDYRLTFSLRFSSGKERIMDEYFHRIYVNNHEPVVYVVMEGGKYTSSIKENFYGKLHLLEKQNFLLGNLGRFDYAIETGCIFGAVPFPLLELHNGIETYGSEQIDVNSIKMEQFASDLYVDIDTRVLFNGFIFNRIPLIKLLNLRETVSGKITYGNLSEKNQNQADFPSFMKPANNPYVLLGAGVSNIFRLFMFEYLMEMPQIKSPNRINWGWCVSLNLDL